jgi:hypothetical protein
MAEKWQETKKLNFTNQQFKTFKLLYLPIINPHICGFIQHHSSAAITVLG